MKKWKGMSIVLAVVLLMSIVAGCGQKALEEPVQEDTEIMATGDEAEGEDVSEEQAIEIEDTPLENVGEAEDTPKDVSYTTGKKDTTTTYQPIMVQMDNSDIARKWQTGLSYADVVYETPNEVNDADTRLTAIFNDALYVEDAPEELIVGAVRSVRYYHQWLASEWDALLVHQGGPDATGNPESDIWQGESNQYVRQRISAAGLHPQNADMFMKNSAGNPISDYAMTDLIADTEIFEYEPTKRDPFKYYPLNDYAEEKEIERMDLSFSGMAGEDWVNYIYDSTANTLTRYMKAEEIIDQGTGKPIEVQNLIVQYINYAEMPGDPPRAKLDVFGSGEAEFIIHGKHMHGTWERNTVEDSTVFTLESGEEVVLAPGNTWIALHPNHTKVSINYADGTDYQWTGTAATQEETEADQE